MKIFYTIILVFSILIANSQDIVDNEFVRLFKKADGFLYNDNYNDAIPILKELEKLQPENANVKFLLGLCYLNLPFEKYKAINYFEEAKKNKTFSYKENNPWETNVPEEVLLYLGDAYHVNYKFGDAIQNYKRYLYTLEDDENGVISKEIMHKIQMCENGQKIIQDTMNIVIEMLSEKVNSIYADYAPVINANEDILVFTSRRPAKENDKIKTEEGLYFEDIYISERKNGVWQDAIKISGEINTIGHEATIALSPDGTTLLIYKDDKGDGNIYISTKSGDTWSAAQLMGSDINTISWETSASISMDNNTLYFTSDRPGGLGKRDIYVCNKLPNGQWSSAKNIGDIINTEYDEDAPYIHPDGVTLFFGSKGHTSMGGFDLFYSKKLSDDTWTKPINLGFPINTTGDDVFYIPTLDGKRAYYASYKKDGIGEKDIYLMYMDESYIVPLTVVKGKITLEDNKTIPENVNLVLISNSSKDSVAIYKPNPVTGKYIMLLSSNKEYNLYVDAEETLPFYAKMYVKKDSISNQPNLVFEVDENSPYKCQLIYDTLLNEYNSSFVLKDIRPEQNFIIEENLFDEQQDKISENGEKLLNQMVKFVKNNEFTLVVIGYSEDFGSDDINIKKSYEKASKIVEYFVSKKGIDQSKVTARGMGYVEGKKYVEFKLEKEVDVKEKRHLASTYDYNNKDKKEKKSERKLAESKTQIENKVTSKYNTEKLAKSIKYDDKYKMLILYFDFDSSIPIEKSKNNLDKLLAFMKTNDTVLVEFGGHTDNKGTDNYNVRLSKKRCKYAIDYLVKNGIDKKRLTYNFYGEKYPVKPNELNDGSDNPEGRARNRRVEVYTLNYKGVSFIEEDEEFEQNNQPVQQTNNSIKAGYYIVLIESKYRSSINGLKKHFDIKNENIVEIKEGNLFKYIIEGFSSIDEAKKYCNIKSITGYKILNKK